MTAGGTPAAARPMIRVQLESPFSGDVAANRAYLRRAIRDCLRRGESPYASHQMLTDALDDLLPEERELGIVAGFAWRAAAERTVIYADRGVSAGMERGVVHAREIGHLVEVRRIGA